MEGEVFVNNSGLEFKVLKTIYNAKTRRNDYLIQFLESKSTRVVLKSNIIMGKVKDYYTPSVYGIGILGDFDKKAYPYWKKAKSLWRNMLKRCYHEKDTRGYYGRAFVAPRWRVFELFLRDINQLPGFSSWLAGDNYELDKDIKILKNDTYSPDACMFVSREINRACTSRSKNY